MKQRRITAIVAALALIAMLGAPPWSMANEAFTAMLRGFQEVPPISTTGSGTFQATLSDDDTSIAYELTYEGLEDDVTQAHIHFGQFHVSGNIVAFLCSNLDPQPSDVPEGTPACPTRAGTVTGTLTASNIINRASAQGITTGELAEVLDAMRRGVTYANVHSKTFTSGEIRGQIVKIPGTD